MGKILVTGGTGFIGSHLIDALEKKLELSEKRNLELKKQIFELSPPEGEVAEPQINKAETLANFDFKPPANDHEFAKQLFQASQLFCDALRKTN